MNHHLRVSASISAQRPFRKRYRGACSCGWNADRTWGTSRRAALDAEHHRQYRHYAETVLAAREGVQ